MTRSIVVLSIAFLAASAAPATLAAQVVQGRVLGSDQDEPIDGATIQLLLRGDDRVLRGALSAEDGSFTLEAPGTGTYVLRVSRIGYRTVTTAAFDLVLNTEPFVVEVLIGVDAVPLAPLVVVSERSARLADVRLRNVGYMERKETWGDAGLGFGHFLGPEDLEEVHAFRASQIFQGIRGVRVEGGGGRGTVVTLRPQVTGARCVPPVFINGAPVANGANLDDVVTPRDIIAIEVYRGQTMPARFMRARHECGVIAIWTGAR